MNIRILESEKDLMTGRDLGKTGDFFLVNETMDRFPGDHRNVTLRAMVRMALDMKWRNRSEYMVCEARTTKIVFTTVGKDPVQAKSLLKEEPEIIAPDTDKAKLLLSQAAKLKHWR